MKKYNLPAYLTKKINKLNLKNITFRQYNKYIEKYEKRPIFLKRIIENNKILTFHKQ